MIENAVEKANKHPEHCRFAEWLLYPEKLADEVNDDDITIVVVSEDMT
jgi:hypothetical protein